MKNFLKIFLTILVTLPVLAQQKSPDHVIIIGGGPTACAAATYLARSHINVTVINGSKHPSQMIWADTIENYPGFIETNGADLLNKMQEHAKTAGAKFVDDEVDAVDFSHKPFCVKTSSGKMFCAKAILIATGSQPKELKVPGEQEYRGKGIGICATCDGPLCENKKAILIGGKYDMLRELPILSKYTNDITIINRGAGFQAPSYFKRSFNKKNNNLKPKILNHTNVQEIVGNGEHATGVKIYNTKTRKTDSLEADCIFITIGRIPNSEIFRNYIKTDLKGNIIVDCDGRTNIDGVFAAGDVTDRGKNQIITNAGEGYRAAMSIDGYLQSKSKFEESPTLDPSTIDLAAPAA